MGVTKRSWSWFCNPLPPPPTSTQWDKWLEYEEYDMNKMIQKREETSLSDDMKSLCLFD